MPSAEQWRDALLVPRELTIESSSELLSAIRDKQIRKKTMSRAKRSLTAVDQFEPSLKVSVAPIQLLHRLGIVTTPIIPNLTDICSTWAYIRYLWAFEMPNGKPKERLRLSAAALDIDFHQKGLMSDQIGVGMAALIMEQYFNAPHAADVSIVAKERILPVELAGGASPDYLFSNATGSEFYVVECKGTRCSRNVAVDQLRRGTEQVPSLRFNDSRPPPTALVIATRLTGRQTEVLVVDPPQDENENEPGDQVLAAAKDWAIRDPQEFKRVVEITSQLKTLGYAAADEIGQDIATRELPRLGATWQTTPRETVPRDNDFGDFLGIEQTLPFPDRVRVRVFQGIARDVLRAVKERDHQAAMAAQDELHASVRKVSRTSDHRSGLKETETTDGFGVASVSSDGTILEIRLEDA